MTLEKIKNIAVILAAFVISTCTVVITYQVVSLKKSAQETIENVNDKVNDIAKDYELDKDSWLAWAIKNNKPKPDSSTQK